MSAGHRQPTCDLAAPTRATLVRLVGALVGALAVAVSSMCGAVQAQDEAQPKAAGVAVADDLLRDLQPAGLGWRRVFVSSNWLPRVVGGGYTQLKIDEFSEIMRELRSADEPLRGEARVTGARYSARLDGRQLVDGLAELTVAVGRSGRTLRLEPCGLAIREIRCPTDAMWGSDHLGRLTIRNASAGVVEMDWSLRAVSSPHEPLRFQFAAPACPSSDLQLDLPVGMRPRIAGAVAQPVVQVGEQESQRWVIELGGRNEGELFIESGRGDVESAAKVRIASTYNLLRTGLELRCDVALVAESPLQQIVLSAPSTIKLMSASLGESDLTEKIRVEHRGVDQQIRISFAQPIEGAGHSLRLAFFHKPEFNRPWSLPRIRFANDDWWREEKTAIVLADDLQLRSIETEHAQQRSYRDEREGGQSLDVQHLTKDASITLDVAPREPRLRAAIGATIRVDESAMRADVIADIDSELGETFEIPLQVSAGWRVQSLEVEPAAALDRDQFSLRVTKGRLIVPLKNPVSRNASLRMIIGATRNAFAGALPTPTERYHVVRIEPAIEQRRVTRFGAATPLQIQFERDGGLQRIADVDLTEGDRSRIDLFEPGLLFQGELSDAIVSFARDEPVFSAIVESSIDVFDQTTDETYSVTVEPESLTVRRVQVHLSRRSDEGLQWSVSGAENGGVLSAERTDDAPGGEGETWNIELRQSQNQRFTLTAARSFPAAPEFEATLIALPGAANHISSLQVNSRGDAPIRVDGSDVTSIPPPIRETGALSTSRGAFRYAVSDKPKLRIQRLDSQRHRLAAWAWMAVVHSRFNINGVGRHTAVYHLQNAGASHVEVLPPRKASDIHISVDGKPVISDDPWGGVRAPLPVGERFPTLRVEYRTFDEPLMNAATLTAPLPNLNIEVLRQDWRVSPPSGYRPATGDDINWSRRLFGDWQLAPAAWGPLSWFAHPTRPIQQPDGDLERARIVLDNAWRAIDLSEATWSDLFEDWQQLFVEGDESGSPAVLIDFTALDALGLRPNSDLPLDRADPAAALAAARLSVVSLGRGRIAVTSTGTPHDDLIARPLCRIDSWAVPVRPSSTPWSPDDLREFVRAGGLSIDISNQSASLKVRNRVFFSAMGWCALIACFGVVGALCHRRRGWGRWVALAAVLFALAAPSDWVFLSRGILWGVLASVVLSHLIRRQTPIDSTAAPGANSSQSSAFIVSGTAATAWLLICLWHAPAQGQGEKLLARLPVDRANVFVPIDDDGAVQGTYVYVPRDFHARMIRRYTDLRSHQQNMLLQRAVYQTRISNSDDRLHADEFVAELTFAQIPTGDLALSFSKEQVEWREVLVDGQVVGQVHWSSDGRLIVPIESPDAKKVEIAFSAVERAGQRLEFQVPRSALSTLFIETTLDEQEFETNSAGGSYKDTGRLRFDYGATERLEIFQREQGSSGAAAIVDEHHWLRIRPDSVVLDVRLEVVPGDSPLSSLAISADSTLQLLPLSPDLQVESADDPEYVGKRRHVLTFSEAVSEPRQVGVSFLLPNTSGVGLYSYPTATVVNRSAGASLFAVTVDPALSVEEFHDSELPSADGDAFARLWSMETPPDRIYQQPPASKTWRVETALPVWEGEIEEFSDVIAGARSHRIYYEARVTPERGYLLRHEIEAPSGIELRSVTVDVGQQTRAVPAAINAAGVITAFLDSSINEPYILRIEGEVQPQTGFNDAPILWLRGRDVKSRVVTLFRGFDIRRIDLNKPANAEVETALAGEYRPNRGRVVGRFQFDADSPRTIRFRAAAKSGVTADSVLVTQVSRENDRWIAEAQATIVVPEKRLLDQLRFDAPQHWTEIASDPPMIIETIDDPASTRQQLVLYPPQPITGGFRVRLFGVLGNADNDDRLRRAPDIVPLDLKTSGRFVVLPRAVGDQQYRWQLTGLLPGSPPAESTPPSRPGEYETFRVTGKRFQASVDVISRIAGRAQVSLVDYHVTCLSRTKSYGVATFDLEPRGQDSCELAVPAGVDLIYLEVGGVPRALPLKLKETLSVALGPAQTPQRITLIFRHDGGELEVPSIREIAVGRTLWTVQTPRSQSSAATGLAIATAQATEHSAIRLQSVAKLVESSATFIEQSVSQYDVDAWYSPWVRRLAAARADYGRLANVEVAGSAVTPNRSIDVDQLNQSQAAVATQLRTQRLLNQANSEASIAVLPGDAWRMTTLSNPVTTRASFDGQRSSLKMVWLDRRRTTRNVRLTLATIIAGLAISLIAAGSYRSIPQVRQRTQGYLLAGSGLVWWLLLPNGYLGWFLVAAGVAVLIRSRERG